ncbi:MAG: exopolysaccharide Pel transporter PelG [Rickettsiales bacterium]|nr:exopolysaccharide Pel transporter PelG [Rickettsiales bacterium]
MAGIGFTLKKLTQKDDLLGVAHAYGVAMFAAAGPWIFTIFALAGITNVYTNFFGMEGLINFRVVVIYNFAFSLVLSAPVYMVATRYIADNIHRKNVTNVPSIMIGTMILSYAIQLPVGAVFYLGYVDLPLSMQLSAMLNLFMLTTVWLLGVFLTALKDYNAVGWAYGIGMVIAVVFAQVLKDMFDEVGMLNGFTVGLAFIVFSLAAKVFSEYAYKFNAPFDLNGYFKKYWELALGGLFYNAAIWVDKWIMWFAPESWVLPSNMRMYPDYDSAMFLAYLTIIPAMAVFVFAVETNFFERYQRFYDNILEHKPLRKILSNHKAVIDSISNSARNFIIVQGTIVFLAIVLAPQFFELINVNNKQIGMFRMGVLGAFFHVLMLFEMIILSYFDCRAKVMWLGLLYLVLNAVLTLVTLQWGFAYYGYGYLLSSMIVFVITSIIMFNYIKKLPYHAFITNNNSITHVKA